MPAAVAVPALIGGAASLGGAYMQSRAAKNAAKTQMQGAQQALGINRDIYRDQQALMAPYIGVGQQSVGLLGRLLGPSEGMRFASPPPQPFARPSQMPQQPPPPFGVQPPPGGPGQPFGTMGQQFGSMPLSAFYTPQQPRMY